MRLERENRNMSKTHENCTASTPETPKVTPSCDGKHERPCYKTGWSIVLSVIAVIMMVVSISGCGKKQNVPESTLSTNVSETTPATEKTPSTSAPEATPTTEETTSTSVPETTSEENAEQLSGIRPEFQKAMDDYEAFFDEYCDILNQYAENPTDLTLLSKYTDMMARLSEMEQSFAEWEDEDLNTTELAYYLKVSARILEKLQDVAS